MFKVSVTKTVLPTKSCLKVKIVITNMKYKIMYIYIVKINLRNLKNVMTQKVKLEREDVCRDV